MSDSSDLEETLYEDDIPYDTEDHAEATVQPLLRGKGRTYETIGKFSNANEADDFLKSEGGWTLKSRNETSEGRKDFYTCKFNRRQLNRERPTARCLASVCLHFADDSLNVTLLSNGALYMHDGLPTDRGLSDEQKESVGDIFASGIQRPKLVLNELRRRGIPEPKITRLKAYLTALRQKKYGSSRATFGELYQWCIERSEIPEDMDMPFVQQIFDESEDTPKIRILFTTKRLISLTSLTSNMHTDATYKLNWNGYPVIVTGCTDKSGRFHPFCLAITTAETETDFAFIFLTIKSLATQLLNLQFNPSILVADCADAIANGFSSAFSNDFIRVNCWAHVHCNMQKQLLTIKSEKLRSQFALDINTLQLAHSVDSFNKAVALFAEKRDAIGEDSNEIVKRQIEQCLQHCVVEYCDRYPGWFEGHAPGHPSHNNALESTNNVIKTEYTMRSRLPVAQFANMACMIVQDWSQSRNPEAINYIPFDCEAPIKEKDYE
uniref:MULE transposase domain-containing protein n=1 Tax=Plectus sambesii TaxID=2011161 RepID=A0A914WTS7_9BILA